MSVQFSLVTSLCTHSEDIE